MDFFTVAVSVGASVIVVFLKSSLDKRERRKEWAREDRNRFHADRRAAYARFLVLARDVYSSTREYAGGRFDEAQGFPQLPLLNIEHETSPVKITPELREAYEVIQILATPAVREAAQRVNDCLPQIIDVVFSPVDCFPELNVLGEKLLAATDELLRAARQELGITDS